MACSMWNGLCRLRDIPDVCGSADVPSGDGEQPGVAERFERLCAAPLDERMLREQILVELRRFVGCDAYVWVTTDPVTAVGVSPLADVPSFSQLLRPSG
jgi:hypothetical protein